MKKVITAILLLVTINSFSQTESRDSVPPIPDSVQIISREQVKAVYENLSKQIISMEDKMTAKEQRLCFESLNAFYQSILDISADEYNKKRQPIKKPKK